ncbi:MAG TPA: MerR family transcriptional regulator [Solirubrobacteraceae bacterium]|nr:MerR family transcriptional regulator [Solirubrobacteraceae bacterium]
MSIRIGELARGAGVTVRALHHYDSLRLLVPSERTQAGHRLYSPADVQRLYRLLALRGVGLPLEEIGPVLDREDGLADSVRRHLGRVEQQLGALEELRRRLTRLLAALDGDEASTAQFLDAMEAMTMFEKYYTAEQLQQLEQRRQEFGDDRIKQVEQEWADLYARLRELRKAGVDPADPEPQALGRRAGELIAMFTGDDPGIAASLQKMYETEGPEKASRGIGSPEDFEYMNAIRAASS